MLLRLAYLGIINAFALLRLLPGSDRDMSSGSTPSGSGAAGLVPPVASQEASRVYAVIDRDPAAYPSTRMSAGRAATPASPAR